MRAKSRRHRLVRASILVLMAAGCREKHVPAPAAIRPALVPAPVREAALVRARVWFPPAIPIESVDFSLNPAGEGSFDPASDVECSFTPKPIGGTTPKFFCTLQDGDVLKVKYGEPNGEIPAELAATRLLSALGFPADRMYRVRRVRCLGCPILPQQALQCLAKGGPSLLCMEGASASHAVTFEHVAIERPFDGRKIEAQDDQGWSWYELDRIDPRAGGSPRPHVDALRLIAVLLAHWDNKGGNQRLVCPPGHDGADGSCDAPVAMIQDLGSTFGPKKTDLINWKRTPIWIDPRACRVSMAALPFGGATFAERQISEAGRQFAARLLGALTRAQISTLFEAAGVSGFNHMIGEAHSTAAWTDAFLAKVDAIAAAGPCPHESLIANR